MRKRLSILVSLLVLTCGWSVPAWSFFDSKGDLFNELSNVGVEEVVLLENVSRYTIHLLKSKRDGTSLSLDLADYDQITFTPANLLNTYLEKRVVELDYAYSSDRNTYRAFAYNILDTFVCYRHEYFSLVFGNNGLEDNFRECFMLPQKIDKVVEDIANILVEVP